MCQHDLAALPKAHNHVHLDGAMRPETLRELSEARGLTVPKIEGYGSFAHFSETIAAVQAVVSTRRDLERLVEEVVEDNARDGAVWLEVSVWPGALPANSARRRTGSRWCSKRAIEQRNTGASASG